MASNNSLNVLKIIDIAIIRRNRKIEIYRHFSTTQQFSSSHWDSSFTSQLIFNVSTSDKFVPPESFRNATPKAVTSFWSMLLWCDLDWPTRSKMAEYLSRPGFHGIPLSFRVLPTLNVFGNQHHSLVYRKKSARDLLKFCYREIQRSNETADRPE